MGSYRRQRRARAAALGLVAIVLAACGEKTAPLGELGAVRGFVGGVVAEEPRAALIARDALSAGGTAADAAVAGFFALSTTYPAGAGLGGGGVCVIYDAKTNRAETLEFLSQPPTGGASAATPGAARGMAALHARYGRLQWSQLVSSAEALARFGFPISRALAARIAETRDELTADPGLRAAFLRPDGGPKREGDSLNQPELSATLSQLRSRGAGDLYGGQAGHALAQAGGPSIEELRSYRPTWRPTESTKIGNLTVHVASPPPRGGPIALELIQSLPEQGLDAIRMAFGQMTPEQQAPAGEAGLAAADREGSAVACTFSMGAPFGVGRIAPGTGVALASPVAPQGDFLSPLVAVNHNVDQAYYAAAGSGGWTAPVEAARVTDGVLVDGRRLEEALAAAATEQAPGRVHALWCPEGVRRKPERCEFRADPRAHGLAASGDS